MKNLEKSLKIKKKLFIIFGLINLFLTNIILQVLLFLVPTIFATFVSQIFNFLFGFYLYGKKVFKVRHLNNRHFMKYFLLSIIVWNINWLTIIYLSRFIYSENIIALFLVPPLAMTSYISQKYFVFKIKKN